MHALKEVKEIMEISFKLDLNGWGKGRGRASAGVHITITLLFLDLIYNPGAVGKSPLSLKNLCPGGYKPVKVQMWIGEYFLNVHIY